jgi:hypothetical protein
MKTFPPGNARALNQILVRLRDDPALRLHLANLAQAKARLYSWERTVFEYEQIMLNWHPNRYILPIINQIAESNTYSIHR